MNKEELAQLLDGCEYPLRLSKEIKESAKQNNLVIVYGSSDDLIEFDGAIYDEGGCYDGGVFSIEKSGILPDFDEFVGRNGTEKEFKEYFAQKEVARAIEAVWDDGGISWTYKTDIPHSTFKVMEDGEVYCIGMVFSLDDLSA